MISLMKTFFCLILSLSLLFLGACSSPSSSKQPPAPLLPVPSEAQLEWHKMEMYAFIHFTTNTFTNLEWGYGDESPEIFNPTELDTDQWMEVFTDAGFTGVILTAKHHDGFSLWPSEYTDHDVANSPYKDGEGDIVGEVSESARDYGLKFGVYLSPWDRNHPDYGSPEYIDYYRNQLEEIFTNYGPVFEMWFDGANGGDGYYGGANETRNIDRQTYYRWPETLDFVRSLQPEPQVLFFSDAGPDIRWVGNEDGWVNQTNWNTINNDTLYAGQSGINDLLSTGEPHGTQWIPAEVDVSIRPGWFYHPEEDAEVKTPEELFDIYLSSVGRGSNLLLNIPPDRRGLIHENDVESLRGFRELLDEAFSENLIIGEIGITADHIRGGLPEFGPQNLIDRNDETYWAVNDGVTQASFTIELDEEKEISYVLLKETIRLGQRVKEFTVDAFMDGEWSEIAEGTTIGYKRILPVDGVVTDRVRVNIKDAQAAPVLTAVELY